MNVPENLSTGLSEAGRAWLETSAALPLAGLGDIDHLLRSISRTFGLTTRETMVATCSTISMMVGPSATIMTPFGSVVPCSLQLLVACGNHSNVFGAVESLGDGVFDMFARMLGRRRIGSSLKPNDPAIKLLDLRKQQIFPLGELLTSDMAKKLVEEDGDCTFGSLSYELALAEIRKAPAKDALLLDQIIRAGWRGTMVAAVEGHPVYPTISLLWGAESNRVIEAVQEGILERLPGLLVVKPKFTDAEQHTASSPWPDSMRGSWIQLLSNMFKQRLGAAPRHIDPQSPLELSFEDDAADEVAAVGSFAKRYSLGHGAASRLLSQAPLQVAKIAGLLTIAQSSCTISKLTVEFAKEIYRGLCSDTLAVVTTALEASPDSYASKRRRILEKLRIIGALTLKDLASTYPKLAFEDLPRVVLSMVDEGVIEHLDGALKAVFAAPTEQAQEMPSNVGAITS